MAKSLLSHFSHPQTPSALSSAVGSGNVDWECVVMNVNPQVKRGKEEALTFSKQTWFHLTFTTTYKSGLCLPCATSRNETLRCVPSWLHWVLSDDAHLNHAFWAEPVWKQRGMIRGLLALTDYLGISSWLMRRLKTSLDGVLWRILFVCLFVSPAQTSGFPDSSVGKESACNAGDPNSIPGLGRSAGEGIGYPLQYSWASLVAQLVKNLPAMWETWVESLGWEDPLEKGMATHSSILDWRVPRTIQSMGRKESDMTEQLSLPTDKVSETKIMKFKGP